MQSAETVLDVLRERGRQGLPSEPRQPPQPEWMGLMARRRRKTLVVCASCHAHIHHGRPTTSTTG
jgi:hypothetical protein